jgi:hypothetical protein
MIEVGVRQDDRIDLLGQNRCVMPVALAPFLRTLKQAAVDEGLESVLPRRISVLMRCFEPVTVPAAPRNWM